ncbi:MAG: hypothetical protein GWP14_05580 [Actinobacteria bacterium]|nr:hypothetical protein [Actinomycetota bacterium]
MSTLSKILVVLLVVLAIAHSAVLLAFLSQQQSWKELAQASRAKWERTQESLASARVAHTQLQERLSKANKGLQADLDRTETDLSKAQATITALQLQLGVLTAEKGSLQQELSKLNASLALAQEAQKHAISRLDAARNTASKLAAENAQLETQLSESTANVTSLRAEVRSQKERIYSLQSEIRKVQGLASSRSLPTVASIRSTPVVTAQPIRGRVTDVDMAEKIAQINVGQIAGVAEGTRFIIYHDSEYVGDLAITRVSRDQSLGTILLSSQPVKVGDEVATELK